MKISHISIRNILGVAELEFSPEGFTEISGPNGSGKTSVLEAIKSVLSGGHDATLLRKGAEKGEIVLLLDDGTQIKRRVGANTSTTDVVRDGKKVTRPSEVLKALTDMLSVNPVDFLRAPKKDRVRVLLEAMPLEADTERLAELSGVPVKAAPGTHALHVINLVHQQVYDERTGTNRAVREKESTINQLRSAMPDAPGGVEGDEDELRAQIQAADDAYNAEDGRITKKLDGFRAERDESIRALEAQIANLRVQIEQERNKFTTIEAKAQTQRNINTEKRTAAVTPLNHALDAIRGNRDAAARRKATKATIDQMESDLEQLNADAAKQTKALADIEQYKSDLLASLPIPGLEVRDGEIFRDGIPFDRLNTAQQVDVAVEIAKLRAGDLGVACVDGLELLDSDAYEAFRQRAEESDIQLFVTRVGDGEFAIR